LQGENPDDIVAAIRQLGESGSATAVQPLVGLLESGPPDRVTEAAIEALGSLGNAGAVDILTEFAHHRRPAVRVLSLQSLSGMRGRRVESALTDALRDSNAEVRATAATALGDGGYTEAIQVLFQAYDRGVSEACAAIGKLGDRAAAERLAGYLGRGDLPTLLEGLGEFIRRDAFDVEGKRIIVERLLELAGPQVREFLVSALAELPELPRNRRLRQDIEAAIAQIPEE
jgi:HEAT repeat protein